MFTDSRNYRFAGTFPQQESCKPFDITATFPSKCTIKKHNPFVDWLISKGIDNDAIEKSYSILPFNYIGRDGSNVTKVQLIRAKSLIRWL